ncbi:MAG: hypothetical protein DBX03_01880 [Puniceicoccaceae bacterium]|nr:MAG: hypothetical protein DBX03_01880 [Puniceicoccaceae bacterium]
MNAESIVSMLAKLFQNRGADVDQAERMASQLIKRARQIAEVEAISEKQALEQLLKKITEAQ